jgi:hypothetical protein
VVGFIIEFSLVVAWFLWLHRRQVREREKSRRVPLRQMHLDLDHDREVEG